MLRLQPLLFHKLKARSLCRHGRTSLVNSLNLDRHRRSLFRNLSHYSHNHLNSSQALVLLQARIRINSSLRSNLRASKRPKNCF
jgi:hypothetical protein